MYRKSSVLLLTGSIAAVIIVFLSLIQIPSGTSSPKAKGGIPESPLPTGKQGSDLQHIVVSVSMEDGQFDDLMEATSRFMDQHPNISIELYNIERTEAYESWKNSAQLGMGADVALMDNEWVREFAVLGYLKPLDSLVAAMPADWLNGLLEPVNWNGYWWGLPKDADPLVVVWSRPLLDSLTSQSIPDSWSRFVELAVSAGAALPDTPLVKFNSADARQLLVWLDSFPSSQRTEMLRPFDKETVDRLSFLAVGNGQAFLISRSNGGSPADALVTGKLLSAVMRWSDVERLSADKRSLLSIGYPNGWYGGRSFVVFAHSEGKDEAIGLWLQDVASETEQQASFDRHSLLPSLKPLYSTVNTGQYTASGSRKAGYEWLKQLNAKPEEMPDPQWPLRLAQWEQIWLDTAGSDRWLAQLVERWSNGTSGQTTGLPSEDTEAEEGDVASSTQSVEQPSSSGSLTEAEDANAASDETSGEHTGGQPSEYDEEQDTP